MRTQLITTAILAMAVCLGSATTEAAKVSVNLGDAKGVRVVGALQRWDADGNHRRKVDPNAKIEEPYLDARAVPGADGQWVFNNLPKGTYDLVILGEGKIRVEGFTYPPVLEFDPFLPGNSTTDDETREFIVDDIKKSRHYENKVVPLYMGGNEKVVRVLVMLIRDQATSYTAGAGTMRHEVWQYDWNYGGWQKNKRTQVLDRVLLQVSDLRRWTWLWDAKLGGIEVGSSPITIDYDLRGNAAGKKLLGLYPY